MTLEPNVEKVFHDDSYGYRPGRSPLDAVAACRQRCFKNDWVVDLDVKSFFDTVPWDLMLRAVARHTDQKWVLLYVERWLKAPMLMPDGSHHHHHHHHCRRRQGGVRSTRYPRRSTHMPAPR